jgi:glyoxylase-like metal-dependent hydrolase (beta-lactamase superfamily II)
MTPLRVPITPLYADDLEIVHTAGHSSDHQVAWDPKEGTLFAGDLFLGVKVRVAHEHEEPRRLVTALRRMVDLGPVRLFDGHRGLVERPVQALEAKIAWTEETIGRIETLIDRGDSVAAISRAVLGAPAFIDFASRGEYSRLNLVRAIRRTRPAG